MKKALLILCLFLCISSGIHANAAELTEEEDLARRIALMHIEGHLDIADLDLLEAFTVKLWKDLPMFEEDYTLFCYAPEPSDMMIYASVRLSDEAVLHCNCENYSRQRLLNEAAYRQETQAGYAALPECEAQYGNSIFWNSEINAQFYDAFGCPPRCTYSQYQQQAVYLHTTPDMISWQQAEQIAFGILRNVYEISEDNLSLLLCGGALLSVNGVEYYNINFYKMHEDDYLCMFTVPLRASDGACYSSRRWFRFDDEFERLRETGEDVLYYYQEACVEPEQ